MITASPRTWRCFLSNIAVGVSVTSLLHACGGVSKINLQQQKLGLFSPRMWRCFWWIIFEFSPNLRLLHARGGVSEYEIIIANMHESSLRTWSASIDIKNNENSKFSKVIFVTFLAKYQSSIPLIFGYFRIIKLLHCLYLSHN